MAIFIQNMATLPFYISFINNNSQMSYQKSDHYVDYNKHVSFDGDLLKLDLTSGKENVFVIMF